MHAKVGYWVVCFRSNGSDNSVVCSLRTVGCRSGPQWAGHFGQPIRTSRNQGVDRKEDNSFWKGVMFATFLETPRLGNYTPVN